MFAGRSQAAVCAFDGAIYAVGGCDAWKCLSSGECYDPATDEWTYIPMTGTPRRGAGIQVFNGELSIVFLFVCIHHVSNISILIGKLYVVGGSDGQSSLASVEIFDPQSGTWSFGPSLSVPRNNVGVMMAQGRLFAVGGFSGKAFLNSIEYLSADGRQWCGYVPNENKKLAAATSQHSLDGDLEEEERNQPMIIPSANGAECAVTLCNSDALNGTTHVTNGTSAESIKEMNGFMVE